MTSELRPALQVADDCHWEYEFKSDEAAAAVIEADREAVRAELVREIVAWLRKGEKPFSDCDCAAHLLETGEWKL